MPHALADDWIRYHVEGCKASGPLYAAWVEVDELLRRDSEAGWRSLSNWSERHRTIRSSLMSQPVRLRICSHASPSDSSNASSLRLVETRSSADVSPEFGEYRLLFETESRSTRPRSQTRCELSNPPLQTEGRVARSAPSRTRR